MYSLYQDLYVSLYSYSQDLFNHLYSFSRTSQDESVCPPNCIKTVHLLYQKRTNSYITDNYCTVNHLCFIPACCWKQLL